MNMVDDVVSLEEFKAHSVIAQFLGIFKEEKRDLVAKTFYRVWSKHYRAWESDNRRYQHSLDNISKVLWDNPKQLFKVYYKKTDDFSAEWYHYTLDGKWY